jgi:NAD(P)-dependent dehydrogenase (short-subunit alcohol dehydrogenase family)
MKRYKTLCNRICLIFLLQGKDAIAKAVLFLASDNSAYVQSVEFFVDGGIVGSPNGEATFRSV